MKKCIHAFLKTGKILTILFLITFILGGAIFIALGILSPEIFAESELTTNEITAFEATYITLGIVFLILSLLSIPSLIVLPRALSKFENFNEKRELRGIAIAVIVVSAIFGNTLPLIAGILMITVPANKLESRVVENI